MMDALHEQLETLIDFPTGAWPAHARKAIVQGIDSAWHQFQAKRRASTITFRAPRLRSWGALLRLAQDELTKCLHEATHYSRSGSLAALPAAQLPAPAVRAASTSRVTPGLPNKELPVTVAEGTGAAVRHLIPKSTSIHARPTARANSAAATSAPLRKKRPPSAHEAHAHQHHGHG